MKKYLKFIPCLTTLAVMTAIFIFSSQNADVSADTSTDFVKVILDTLQNISDTEFNFEIIDKIEHFVRKAAHFCIYALLGLNVYIMFKSLIENIRNSKNILYSTAFCYIYACTDEIHQLFSDGRSGQFSDVLLDTSGALTGALFIMIIMSVYRHIRKNTKEENA